MAVLLVCSLITLPSSNYLGCNNPFQKAVLIASVNYNSVLSLMAFSVIVSVGTMSGTE